MADNPFQTINILGKLLEPTQRKLTFLLKCIKEEQNKYSILCKQLMNQQDNIQNDKNIQHDITDNSSDNLDDIEESFKKEKEMQINSAASTQKKQVKQKKDKKSKSISKFDKSLIKTHQRFGNKLKKIIFYDEIPDDNSDQKLNHMLESSDCEFPILDEMAKVIEEGVGPVNPNYLIYLIGIDVYNPYLEQLFKNEFYSAAMKSVIKMQEINSCRNEYADNQEVEIFEGENNNQEMKNLKQIIYQFYIKKKQQLFNQLKVLLKLTGRIWVVQKQSLQKISTSNQTQSSFSKIQSQQPIKQSNYQNNQQSIKSQQMLDDKQNIIMVTKVSKSQSITQNRIRSLEQPKQMINSTRSIIRNQNKKFFCKQCQKYFKLKWSLDEHVRCYHPNHSIYMESEDKIMTVDKDEQFDSQMQNYKNHEQ